MTATKKALVTGASRGIGRAVARALDEQGYRVHGTSRRPDAIKERIEGVEYHELDLASEASIATLASIGDIDVLINNAGQSQIGAVEDLPLEEVREDFQVNLFGVIQLTQAFLPSMRKRKQGFIINIGSLVSTFAIPYQSVYTASKFALAGFSWSLRNEVMQHGIKVVVIDPNDIRTTIEPRVTLGDSGAYNESVIKMRKARDRRMADAADPSIVAEKVLDVLAASNPKPFYAVGGLGPLMIFLRRFFPDSAVEKMVRMSYDLD